MDGLLNPEDIIRKCAFFNGAKVADFGCGHGHLTLLIAKEIGNEGKIYAFDILDEALEGLLRKAHSFGFKNIEAKKTNLALPQSTALRENSCDFVFAANMMFQNPDEDKIKILNEAYRILKHGGKLIVIDWSNKASFGPKEHKIDSEKFKEKALQVGFNFLESFNAGIAHFGLIFVK